MFFYQLRLTDVWFLVKNQKQRAGIPIDLSEPDVFDLNAFYYLNEIWQLNVVIFVFVSTGWQACLRIRTYAKYVNSLIGVYYGAQGNQNTLPNEHADKILTY